MDLKDALAINTIEVSDFIGQWEKFAKAYFFKPPTGASSRRYYAEKNSKELSINVGPDTYTGKIEIDCSAANVYCTRTLLKNGTKVKITPLKKILKEATEYPNTCKVQDLPLLIGTKFEPIAKERLKSVHLWTEND